MSTHTHTQSYYNATLRFGYKWNVNECLRLHREFELLKLSVPEIAALHGRTIKAIMYKIDLEGFATFNDLFIQTYGQFDSELVPEGQVLHLVPADLESESEYSDDDDANDDDEEDDDDANDDDDYVPSFSEEEDEEEESSDDGSNKHYLYSQVKRMQKQITAILGYLSKGAAAAAATEDTSLFSYGNM
jgi:hypothetical protein